MRRGIGCYIEIRCQRTWKFLLSLMGEHCRTFHCCCLFLSVWFEFLGLYSSMEEEGMGALLLRVSPFVMIMSLHFVMSPGTF